MKNKLCIFASVLVVLCMLCSCGGSGGSDESDAQKTVAISFAVDSNDGALRTATVTNPDLTTGLTYQYKATAKWNSTEFGKPKGDTNGSFVTFLPKTNVANSGTSITFAQGKWDIEVQVLKGDVVVYKSDDAADPIYINASTGTIEVTVEKTYGTTAKGTITIKDFYAPDTSGADKLVVSYGALGSTTVTDSVDFAAGTYAAAGTGTWAGYNKYNASIANVPAGAYWVTVAYYNGTNLVGGSTVNADIIATGLGSEISGSIQNGVWTSSLIQVKGVKTISAPVTYTTTATDNSLVLSKTAGEKVNITCTATITDVNTGEVDAGTKNYTLCVNSAKTLNTTGIFEFKAADYAEGTYSIYIIAADSTNKISITATPVLNVTVNP